MMLSNTSTSYRTLSSPDIPSPLHYFTPEVLDYNTFESSVQILLTHSGGRKKVCTYRRSRTLLILSSQFLQYYSAFIRSGSLMKRCC